MMMNRKQKSVLVLYTIAVLFFSIMYLPWSATATPGGNISTYVYYFAPIWSSDPPIPNEQGVIQAVIFWRVQVNVNLWLIELFVLSLIAGMLIIILDKKSVNLKISSVRPPSNLQPFSGSIENSIKTSQKMVKKDIDLRGLE